MTASTKLSKKNEHFFSMVYFVVKQIPRGRVTSYGAIARYLGMAKSSRMVGWAMNSAHSQPGFIPAHRVVNRNGMLTGKNHFATPFAMQERLEAEGVEVKNDQVQNFDQLVWEPQKELE
jgi:methylated-DNA-protein-cysteine methyltransferase-like protein